MNKLKRMRKSQQLRYPNLSTIAKLEVHEQYLKGNKENIATVKETMLRERRASCVEGSINSASTNYVRNTAEEQLVYLFTVQPNKLVLF